MTCICTNEDRSHLSINKDQKGARIDHQSSQSRLHIQSKNGSEDIQLLLYDVFTD